MPLLSVIPTYTAIKKLKEQFGRLLRKRSIPIEESFGQVLAEDIYASSNLPDFDKSTVDGYAVVSRDTQGASSTIPVMLDNIGDVKIGTVPEFEIKSGETAYVPTGGMIPKGADGVVMVEYSHKIGKKIALEQPISELSGVIPIGEDIKKGELLLEKGHVINSASIGLLTSQNIDEVEVFDSLKIGIISTGDELIGPEEELKLGKIRDLNSITLSTMAKKMGLIPTENIIINDDPDVFIDSVKKLKESSDIVVLSGGSSKGKEDYTLPTLESMGDVMFHGLAMRPGKPTLAAYDDETLYIGLPGHPMAAILVWELIVGRALRSARSQRQNLYTYGNITTSIPGTPGRDSIIPVKLKNDGDNYTAQPIYGTSATISTLTGADGYILIDRMNEGISKGDEVKVNLFDGGLI